MYTEDDKNVKIKKSKSTSNNTDFYTAFNKKVKKNPPKNDKTQTKNDKKPEQPVTTPEDDYASFYSKQNLEQTPKEENPKDYSGLIKKIIIAVGVILLLFLIFMLVTILIKRPDIKLDKENIILNIGDKANITYQKVNTEEEVIISYTSSDNNIAIVNESGQITAMGIGKAVINIDYSIGNSKKSKKCNVEVNNNNNVNSNISLSLSIEDGVSGDTWRNTDAAILVKPESIFGIESVKYAINCDSGCNYTPVSDNRIMVSENGTNKVKVVAVDRKNQETTGEITVNIDREAPTIALDRSGNIVSDKSVEVCATCTDKLSGCKEAKVCKKYTSTKTNEVITVYDKAGNKANSNSYNVIINTVPINPNLSNVCSLSVTSDGTVKATLREASIYYGFNSKYTGSNELSKKIEINASKKGESKAQVVNYYVKSKNGTTGTCVIIVIKSCACKDKNSTASNCEVSCTFTSK